MTIEALQEILQRRSEVREPERETQRMQDVSQGSIASQREETPIREVEVISVKRTKVEQEEKKPIRVKEAPMSCPIKPKTPGDVERQPTYKSPPQPKPKVVMKAPPPTLVEEEESELPPPHPAPEVRRPSEIPKEIEVPHTSRLMTPERKTYAGNQRQERQANR
jgi:hypothetical protein